MSSMSEVTKVRKADKDSALMKHSVFWLIQTLNKYSWCESREGQRTTEVKGCGRLISFPNQEGLKRVVCKLTLKGKRKLAG